MKMICTAPIAGNPPYPLPYPTQNIHILYSIDNFLPCRVLEFSSGNRGQGGR